ncbi:hypothetical protein [Glutamicibacter sp.]|uniref:hypothetical protein n=1 Tax=Glutamicibacter sp. TaxID=1931995 RepID=UPI0028BF4D63|nr:hypothetical protein [Glutamicibacter sp.]
MNSSRARRVSATKLSSTQVENLTILALARGHEVFRCHSRFHTNDSGRRSEQGSWFFASSAGRFDLSAPRGTLNVAAGRIGAVCESLGVLTLDEEIPIQELAARKLVALALPEDVALVDFTDRKAAQASRILAAEMSGAAEDYRDFQSLAASVDAAGMNGICSRLRFSGPENENGCFIFGEAGPRNWPAGKVLDLMEEVMALGYSIVDDEGLPVSEVNFQK